MAFNRPIPSIIALFFIGVFWKRANADGALAGIAIGIVSAAFFLGFSDSIWMPTIHFLYVVVLGLSLL